MPLELPIVHPRGIESVTGFPNFTRGLLARGYPEADVRKIMGENWLRLFREVWR